MNVMKNE